MSTFTLNTKVYNGVGFNTNGQSVFKNTTAAFPSGFSYLTSSVKTPTGGKDSVIRYNLSVPHIAAEPTSCACPGGVLGTDYVRLEVSVSAASSQADREDLYLRILNLVQDLKFKASVETLVQPT